jgi:hypothetical protein
MHRTSSFAADRVFSLASSLKVLVAGGIHPVPAGRLRKGMPVEPKLVTEREHVNGVKAQTSAADMRS